MSTFRMPPRLRHLVNTPEIEIWPAHLVRARTSVQARVLSTSRRVLCRKCDGRYLAAESLHGLTPLLPGWKQVPGIGMALEMLAATGLPRNLRDRLPLAALKRDWVRLGLDADAYAARTGLMLHPEPMRLELAGFDCYRRPLWLVAVAGRAWRRMQAAALADGIVLEAVSGYRSHAYQTGIFRRKLQRGVGIEQILAVNAAPGFSEHHSGRALDIGTPGRPPLEECFEATPAFIWLCAHAGRFGFGLSYPRDNPHGIVYEPWHWRYDSMGETRQ